MNKERLNEVKERSTGIYSFEEEDIVGVDVKLDDYEWLIKQAERADRNKEELEVLDKQLYSTQQQVQKLKESLKESAVKFAESSERVQELEEEINTHAPNGRNYTNEQYVDLLNENKRYREAKEKMKIRIKNLDERIERLSKEPQFYDRSGQIGRMCGEALGLEKALEIINEELESDGNV